MGLSCVASRRKQSFCPRLFQRCGTYDQRQARAFFKQGRRHAFIQAQRIHHELERQVAARERAGVGNVRALRDRVHVLLRMLGAHLPQDAVVKAELGMRARADAEVVAKLPVVEVVAAGVLRAGVGRGFVMLHARLGQPRFDGLLHVRSDIVIRQIGRRGVAKRRVGFEREVIGRQMRRLERQRRVDIGQRLVQRLPRQGKHQVEIEGVEMRGCEFSRTTGFGVVVDAPERLQMPRVEALDAERDPRDARLAKACKFGRFHRAGVGFQRDLRVGQQLRERAHAGQNAVDACYRKQAGGAAAKKHGVDSSAPDIGQRALQIQQQGIDVCGFGNALRCVRIEVAIRALLHAPRQVDIERQWRRNRQAAAGKTYDGISQSGSIA